VYKLDEEDGILDEFGVEILGTDLHAINRAEDRELFRSLMLIQNSIFM